MPSAHLIEWENQSLDDKLTDWVKDNQNLFVLDCGATALTSASWFCVGLFRFAALFGLTATIGARANYSVDQQLKLEHLYKLYKDDVEQLWQGVNETSVKAALNSAAPVIGLVTGLMTTAYNAATNSTSASVTPKEPDSLKILKVIGPYLSPEEIIVWKCKAQALPAEYKQVLFALGIFPENNIGEATKLEMVFQRGLLVNNEKYSCYASPAPNVRWANYARSTFYGLNSRVSSVLSPVGETAQQFIEGAGAFFGRNARAALPTIVNAAGTIHQAAGGGGVNNNNRLLGSNKKK